MYIHLGLKAGLLRQLRAIHTRVTNIDIQMNVDGIRAYNNSFTQVAVTKFAVIFGPNHLVYNIRLFSHSFNFVKLYGCLDCFSCFPYESELGHLKHYMHGPKPPAVQLYRRLVERVELDAVEGGIFLDDSSTRKGSYGGRSENSMFINRIAMVAVKRNTWCLILPTNRNLDAATEKFPNTNIRQIEGIVHRWIENERQKVRKRLQKTTKNDQ
ncbi:hypothetical protein CLF_106398 [Clonorchis sinensis]|uniref:Uncharacterized protein n=1 Tax=Clonorchis sinensis TaxID=79923 RepID=G7YF42_CLOSI|nr:hypothetical protein CLF_106398 [Clonorchis sinensis]